MLRVQRQVLRKFLWDIDSWLRVYINIIALSKGEESGKKLLTPSGKITQNYSVINAVCTVITVVFLSSKSIFT